MADSSTIPQDRVRIFDRNGFPLVEFRAAVERSWAIGDEGRALFQYASRKTDIVNEKNFQFGNWLLVQNTQLPAWVGVIDTPRQWNGRQVAVHAYTPDHVFGQRRGPLEEKLTGSGGTIFENLLGKVNAQENTIMQVGNIWGSGAQREETLNPNTLDEDLKRLFERSGEEYAWRAETDNSGRLIVYGDWVKQLGKKTTALLHEGKGGGNIEALDNVLVEDGEIYNEVLAYGDGESWKSKPFVKVADANSRHKYGLRQTPIEFTGVTTLNTLKENGLASSKASKQPINTFHANALNVGNTFKYCRLGNTLTLSLENMGFGGLETTVRIVGMDIKSAQKNKVELVLEEVL